MYVVTYNDEVLLGPIPWNAKMFNTVIEEDTGLIVNLSPLQRNDVPIDLNNGIKIRSASENKPDLNEKIQIHVGSTWTFTTSTGVYNYTVVDKPLHIIRLELKNQTASERWQREHQGTKITIQNQEVTLDTSRGARDIFSQKYMLMEDNSTIKWKFPEGWLTITKLELKQCVDAIAAHVQSVFDWEFNLVSQIDNATTHSELNNIIVVDRLPKIQRILE